MKRKTLRLLFVAAGVALGFCRTAHSTLFVDLRVTSVSGPATMNGLNSVHVTAPGARIEMDVWARVEGSNFDPNDDGLQSIIGSIRSERQRYWNQDWMHGTLEASLVPAFSAPPSTIGTQADLDGDGDLDIGGTDFNNAVGFYVARAGDQPLTGNLFRVGHVAFRVDHVTSAIGPTTINFWPIDSPGLAVWTEDGAIATAAERGLYTGYGVSVSAVAAPEPVMAVLGAVATFASALRPQRRKQELNHQDTKSTKKKNPKLNSWCSWCLGG
ncbi:MAG: hypothetical protein H7Z14_16170 [Anaerolineae bacterium]|nr:hypothetical protein [Phycisphaerae bacterium]